MFNFLFTRLCRLVFYGQKYVDILYFWSGAAQLLGLFKHYVMFLCLVLFHFLYYYYVYSYEYG